MDAKTTYLAYSRLAKTQVSFWGHPVSFNLASMDYSISGENFGSFQEFYSEQLITFGGITTKFGMDVRVGGSGGGESESERVRTLKRLGLVGVTEETRIYLCFQVRGECISIYLYIYIYSHSLTLRLSRRA